MKNAAKKFLCFLIISALPFALLSCVTDPQKFDLPIEKTAPEKKVTSFTETMKNFGLMLEIYRDQPIKVMVKEMTDKTGASYSTGSEIQQNITEIVKSTLNSMGENVMYIEYDAEFVSNMSALGYNDLSEKAIPDIIATGAITEFDRALAGWEKGTDVEAEYDLKKVPSWLPSKSIGVEYGDTTSANKARITLDFNLKNFQTLSGIPGMNVVNSMEVQKAMMKKEFGITLFGPTFGSRGSMKKVQGRHDAVRLLVQSGMIQLMGRYAGIPYWKVFGDDAIQDDEVIKSWKRGFPRLSDTDRVYLTQKYLYLHGYDVEVNGTVDNKTRVALQDFRTKNNIKTYALNSDVFLQIYLTVPINETTYERTQELIGLMAKASPSESPSEPAPQETAQAPQPDVKEKEFVPVKGEEKTKDSSRAVKLMMEGFSSFKQGDYLKASKLFDESISISPEPASYYFLALCYQSLNAKQKAIASLEEGTKKFSKDFSLWKALGMSYYENGDKKNAQKAFDTALALKPNDKQVKFFLEKTK